MVVSGAGRLCPFRIAIAQFTSPAGRPLELAMNTASEADTLHEGGVYQVE